MSRRGKISEECKQRLRELEGKLHSIRSNSIAPNDPAALGLIVGHVRGMDERCRELLRGLEPRIHSFRERYDPPGSGTIHDSVARLRMMNSMELFEMVRVLGDTIDDVARNLD